VEKPAEKPRFGGTGFVPKGSSFGTGDYISSEFGRKPTVKPAIHKATGEAFAVGDCVNHPVFGNGTIMGVTKMGADMLYEIAFDTVGTKKMMGSYAKIKKV
jgi:DNA helicase-2/ATP-dependent DNA helicase PcrA